MSDQAGMWRVEYQLDSRSEGDSDTWVVLNDERGNDYIAVCYTPEDAETVAAALNAAQTT